MRPIGSNQSHSVVCICVASHLLNPAIPTKSFENVTENPIGPLRLSRNATKIELPKPPKPTISDHILRDPLREMLIDRYDPKRRFQVSEQARVKPQETPLAFPVDG